jgi:hypothetical protein
LDDIKRLLAARARQRGALMLRLGSLTAFLRIMLILARGAHAYGE